MYLIQTSEFETFILTFEVFGSSDTLQPLYPQSGLIWILKLSDGLFCQTFENDTWSLNWGIAVARNSFFFGAKITS